MSVVTLSTPSMDDVVLDGSAGHYGYVLRGLDGWYDSTGAKTDLTERASGDGAHDIPAGGIRYASRVVTIMFRLLAETSDDRQTLLDMLTRIRRFIHQQVTIRVQDDLDLEARGYVDSIDLDDTGQNVNWQTCTGQISLVCPRPEITSHAPRMHTLIPYDVDAATGGLSYGKGYLTWWEGTPNNSVSVLQTTTAGTTGLRYPLTYTDDTPQHGSNSCLMRNEGSSRAYPVFTIYGTFKNGVSISFPSQNLLLKCTQPVYGEPLVLDSRSRTASIGGLDVSSTLTSRGFPTIPPGSSVNALLTTTGSGYVNVATYDTYL